MSRRILLLLAAVVLAGLSFASVLRSARPPGVLQAVERAAPERRFPARFSTETPYRACSPVALPADSTVPREACGEREDLPLELAGLSQARSLSLDPDTLRASALALVFWWDGEEASLDKAITRLTEALRLGGESAAVLVDLSAAHLARAQSPQNAMDMAVGLEHALHALEIDPENLAARFNAALALDALDMEHEARKEWNAYLAADSTSAWAREAVTRRDAPEGPAALPEPTASSSPAEIAAFAARHPQKAREFGWEVVLGAWGTAVLEDRAAPADSLLRLAQGLGTALVNQSGDESLADAVVAIHTAHDDSSALRTLARAHQLFAAGRTLYEAFEMEAAADSLARVVRLRPASPILIVWTRTWHAAALLHTGEQDRAIAIWTALIAATDSVRHPAPSARLRYMLATTLSRLNEGNEAAGELAAAARIFGRLGEAELYGFARANQAFTAHKRGDTLMAYAFNHQAARALRASPGSRQRHALLVQFAELASKDGLLRAAMRIQEEGLATIGNGPSPISAPEALLGRARVRAAVDQTSSAVADLDSVEVLLASPAIDKKSRNYLQQVLRYSRAVTAPPGTASLPALDSAIAFFAADAGARPWLLPALMRRVDLRIAAGDLPGANADLDSITTQIRRTSQDELGSHERAAVLEQARSRFNQLVMLHVRARRAVASLEVVERGRVSFVRGGSADAPPARRMQPPPGQVLIEYALVGDTLLTWLMRGNSVTLLEQRLDAEDLRIAVERAVAALEARRDTLAMPHLHRLHALLVAPVKERLRPGDTTLVILADGEIAGVPFPALSDGRGGRYLVQDYTIHFAASLADTGRPTPRGPVRSALLIADPDFDRAEHPGLDSLAGADAEVDSLMRLYPGARELRDSGATADTFAALAPAADVIHYAGHAVFDDTRPERSFLVLAGEGERGRLRAESVGALKLSGVRMVVLSACRTLRARQGRSGGFAGLSGAMLSAGAGGVAGSLWEVDDALTQPLMLAFHREYRRTRDPAAALRRAQLEMLRSADPRERSLSAWAGFRYVGR